MNQRTMKVTEEVVEALRTILEDHPEYYLDEIADKLLNTTGKHLSISTIYRTLIEKLQYFLRVCYESALQRDKEHRHLYCHWISL